MTPATFIGKWMSFSGDTRCLGMTKATAQETINDHD